MNTKNKLIKKFNKADISDISLAVVLVYISVLNLFVIHTTPEIIFVQLLFLLFLFKKSRSKNFVKTWMPFIALFVLYEFIRGFVDDYSPFYSHTLYVVYNLENSIFKTLPTTYLQSSFLNNQIVINILLFFYMSFFYYSFFVAFVVWAKTKKLFSLYAKGFLFLSGIGLLSFFLIPTAPPWFVSEELGVKISRLAFENTLLTNYAGVTLYRYFVYGNAVAAMPSLHTAWPAFTSLFLIKHFHKKIFYISLLVPLMISFAVVFMGEHFLLDVFAGWLFAIFALLISTKLPNLKKA